MLGLPGFSAYAASKAAVRNFARAWTMELKPQDPREFDEPRTNRYPGFREDDGPYR